MNLYLTLLNFSQFILVVQTQYRKTFPFGKCEFPFKLYHEAFNMCIKLRHYERERCQTSETPNQRIYCPEDAVGTWGEYEYHGDCTKSCGKGFQLHIRQCYYPPCEGSGILIKEFLFCNDFPCTSKFGKDDCFTGRGVQYMGNVTTSITGKTCIDWNSKGIASYTNLALPGEIEGFPHLSGNVCRNPKPLVYYGPWCYTSDAIPPFWEYCDVPVCPQNQFQIFGISTNNMLNNHGPAPCVFPFKGANGITVEHKCMPVPRGLGKSNTYCGLKSVSSNQTAAQSMGPVHALIVGLRSQTFGYCPTATKGTFSDWILTQKCSKPCGGGLTVMERKCLHTPCNGETYKLHKSSLPCNTHACLQMSECLIGNGMSYTGTTNEGYTKPCLFWSNFENVETIFKPSHYRHLIENYCRNPGGHRPLPWCFVGEDQSYEYCQVTHCSEVHGLDTIPYTIPHKGMALSGKPCHFPFNYKHDWFYTCFVHNANDEEANSYCPLTDSYIDVALCPKKFKGTWSRWKETGSCTKMCGGGKKLFVRECMYHPCNGERFKGQGPCNTQRCNWQKTMVENIDCFIDEGLFYTGNAHTTIEGIECQKWPKNLPYSHTFTEFEVSTSVCRNPSLLGRRQAPWCYIEGSGSRWEYCDIPRCPAHEGEIRTVVGRAINKPCFGPCTPFTTHKNVDLHYCSTDEEHLSETPRNGGAAHWGWCPSSGIGTFSSWVISKEMGCSKYCGGGKLHYVRKCIYPPCSNSTLTKYEGPCNTQECEQCIHGKGEKYMARSNEIPPYRADICLLWCHRSYEGFLPDKCSRIPSDISERHGYCRNLDPNRYSLPYCIVQNTEVPGGFEILACEIPRCRSDNLVRTVGWPGPNSGKVCVFPFKYRGVYKYQCMYWAGGTYWCGVSEGNMDIFSEKLEAQCSKYDRGTWSAWSKVGCTKSCGGGKTKLVRRCLYAPCNGEEHGEGGLCNTQICDKHTNCYDGKTRGQEYYNVLSSRDSCVENVCKNEGGLKPKPFCTDSVDNSLHLCYIGGCTGTVSQINAFTFVPDRRTKIRKFPCIFPFVWKGNSYRKCLNQNEVQPPEVGGVYKDLVLPTARSDYWCGTVDNVDTFTTEWGYCSDRDEGNWGDWMDEPNVCSPACLTVQTRVCVVGNCDTEHTETKRVGDAICNGTRCVTSAWTIWSTWTACDKCINIKSRGRLCRLNSEEVPTINCPGQSFQTLICLPEVSKELSNTADICRSKFAFGKSENADIEAMLEYYDKIKFLGSNSSNLKPFFNLSQYNFITSLCLLYFTLFYLLAN